MITPDKFSGRDHSGLLNSCITSITTSTFAWNTTTAAAGNYEVAIWARNQGQTAYTVSPFVGYTINP